LNKLVYCLVFAAISFSAQSHASEITTALKACASKSDSLERLVCYDDITKSLPTSISTTAENPTVKPDTKASPKINEIPETKTEIVQQSSTPAARKFNPEDSFGIERKYVQNKQANEVTFVIESVSKTLRSKYKFYFKNGQIWEQKDTDKYGKFKAGETVIIKRGVLDAFYLKKPDANRTIRVKRIK
jgi:hypothetical protein